jgi:hypothetical protein
VKATGDIVRVGFRGDDDPMLDTLACLLGAAVGGGRGPSPRSDAGFVAAATAEAYFSSVGGRAGCTGTFGIPFGTGTGGTLAVVDVTMGRLVATLARRLAVTFSLALTGSSFWGVGGCSSVTDCASRDD